MFQSKAACLNLARWEETEWGCESSAPPHLLELSTPTQLSSHPTPISFPELFLVFIFLLSSSCFPPEPLLLETEVSSCTSHLTLLQQTWEGGTERENRK